MWRWILVAFGLLVGAYLVLVLVLLALGRKTDARAWAGFVPDCALLFTRLAGDARVPRSHKWLLMGLVAYLSLPFDLIPDFIPVAGALDDAILVALVLRRVLRGTDAELVRKHWPGPQRSLEVVLRLAEGART